MLNDEFTDEEDFAETKAIWWAGIGFAATVTFAIIGGILVAGTYVLNGSGLADISYWLPTVAAAVLTIVLITVALRRGTIKYEPRSPD